MRDDLAGGALVTVTRTRSGRSPHRVRLTETDSGLVVQDGSSRITFSGDPVEAIREHRTLHKARVDELTEIEVHGTGLAVLDVIEVLRPEPWEQKRLNSEVEISEEHEALKAALEDLAPWAGPHVITVNGHLVAAVHLGGDQWAAVPITTSDNFYGEWPVIIGTGRDGTLAPDQLGIGFIERGLYRPTRTVLADVDCTDGEFTVAFHRSPATLDAVQAAEAFLHRQAVADLWVQAQEEQEVVPAHADSDDHEHWAFTSLAKEEQVELNRRLGEVEL